MKKLLILTLGLVLAGSASAQRGFHGGVGGMRGFGGGFRGGGFHGGFGGFGGFRGGFGGFHGGIGFRPGFRSRIFFGFGRPFRPFAYPIFVGGFGYGGFGYYDSPYASPPYPYPYASPYPSGPNVIVIQPSQPGPEFVSGDRYQTARPEITEYRAPSPAPAPEQIYFLLPLKDKSLLPAVAYWVEGDVLHYITTAGAHHQVNIDQVDREQAAKLNEGRVIQFRLPPPKQ
jgi:hypothetical protein